MSSNTFAIFSAPIISSLIYYGIEKWRWLLVAQCSLRYFLNMFSDALYYAVCKVVLSMFISHTSVSSQERTNLIENLNFSGSSTVAYISYLFDKGDHVSLKVNTYVYTKPLWRLAKLV